MKLKQKKNKNYLRLKINYSIYLVWSNHKADNRHLYTALHCISGHPGSSTTGKYAGMAQDFLTLAAKFWFKTLD